MATNTIESIGSGVRWIGETFAGREALPNKDVSGWMAKWLFRIGAIWAAVLLPITILFSFLTVVVGIDGLLLGGVTKHHDRSWLICPYLLAGYAVWVGWGWRSRRQGHRFAWILFWVVSAGFNVLQPIHIWMDAHDVSALLFPPPLWGILTTVASLVAMGFEFRAERA